MLDKGCFLSLHHFENCIIGDAVFFELLRPKEWLPFRIWTRFYPSPENPRFSLNNGRRRQWLPFAGNSSSSAAFLREVFQSHPQMMMSGRPSKLRQATNTRRGTWTSTPWGRTGNDASMERQTQVTSTGPMRRPKLHQEEDYLHPAPMQRRTQTISWTVDCVQK